MTSRRVAHGGPAERELEPGETLFRAGDWSDFLYLVAEGEIELTAPDGASERVGAGGLFGEMALLGDERRCETAVARTASRVIPVDAPRFSSLVRTAPLFAMQVMTVLADRLRARR